MEVLGVLTTCSVGMMGLAGLFGIVSGVYPVFRIWTGKPGRIASSFLLLSAVASILISTQGWLGTGKGIDQNQTAVSIVNVVSLVGGLTASLLVGWIVDSVNIPTVSRRQVANTCARCGREILTNDQVMTEQVLYVQVGQAQKAREIEQQTGYRCKSCGRQYCKGCLERYAHPHPSGGRACPACGGDFGYM